MEIKKLRAILKDKQGVSALNSAIIVLIVFILFSVVLEYLRIFTIAKGVQDTVEFAVISVITDNWDNSASAIKQGYSGAYSYDVGSWVEDYSTGQVYDDLMDTLGMSNHGSGLTKFIGDKGEYYLSDLEVTIANTGLQSDINELEATAKIKLTIPVDYSFADLPDIVIDLKSKAKFSPKF